MTLLNFLFGLSIIFPLPVDLNIETGFLSQYAQSPSDGTIAYRQSVGQLPGDMSYLDGVIAIADCDKIGDDAWLSIEQGPWLYVMVFDCAGHKSTVEWFESANILGEISYDLAVEYNIVGQGGIEGRLAWIE